MQYTNKKIWKITYPVLISLMMQNLIGITDTAFMGRVGEIELGAAALAGIYYLVIYMLGFGFSIGAEILIGRRNGEGKFKETGRIFYQGIVLLSMMAVVLIGLSHLFSPLLLSKIISSEAVYHATMQYTNWRVYGFLFSFIAIMFRAFYMGTTSTKILTINGVVMLLSNVVLNYMLIFGKFGFPELGIAGAAIGSTLSELISVLFYIIYTRYKTNYLKYGLEKFRGYSIKLQNQILSIASWTMIQQFASCGTWLFFFIATEHLGERSLAISNMVRSVSSLLYIFVAAFASTGSALVSNLMGGGKKEEVMSLCYRIVKICTLCSLPFIIFTFIFPTLTLSLFTNNHDIIQSAVPSLMVFLSSTLFAIPGFVFFLAIAGTGNTKAAMFIEFAILSIYVAYTYYFAFVRQADVAVCWTVEIVYCVLMLIICWSYMRQGRWKSKTI